MAFVYARATPFAPAGTLCARNGFVLRAAPLATTADALVALGNNVAESARSAANAAGDSGENAGAASEESATVASGNTVNADNNAVVEPPAQLSSAPVGAAPAITTRANDAPATTTAPVSAPAAEIAANTQSISTSGASSSAVDATTDAAARTDALSALVANVRPQLFRALIENECTKAHLDELDRTAHHIGCRATVEWIHADLANLTLESDGTLRSGDAAYAGLERKALGTFSKRVTPFTASDGTAGIALDLRFSLSDAVSEYPRVGITLPVSAEYSRASWYGRGAHENYSDRKDGAFVGTYTLPVTALEVPYIVPQENGTRTDVRALALHARDGRVLHFAAATPFAFSLSPHTTADLWKSRHPAELADTSADGGYYTLNIDLAHRGVGTAACGPDTLPPYRVYPGAYALRLYIW